VLLAGSAGAASGLMLGTAPALRTTAVLMQTAPALRTTAVLMQTAPEDFALPTPVAAAGPAATRSAMQSSDDVEHAILVQGGSLRTWSFRSQNVDQVQVVLSTEGRPLDADIELWQGPDNTPCKMRVYIEDGQLRPFSAVVETPRGPNTVSIRNIGEIEFPLSALVACENVDEPSPECATASMIIQGGALRTYPFDPTIDSVQVLLKTDGRPLNARIELLQAPTPAHCVSSDGRLSRHRRRRSPQPLPLSSPQLPSPPHSLSPPPTPTSLLTAALSLSAGPQQQQAGDRAVHGGRLRPALLLRHRDARLGQRRPHPQHRARP